MSSSVAKESEIFFQTRNLKNFWDLDRDGLSYVTLMYVTKEIVLLGGKVFEDRVMM